MPVLFLKDLRISGYRRSPRIGRQLFCIDLKDAWAPLVLLIFYTLYHNHFTGNIAKITFYVAES